MKALELAQTLEEYADMDAAEHVEPIVIQLELDAAAELRRLHAENEALRVDAERFRFANDSDEDFAICYWDDKMGSGGEWMCNGYKGNAIDLLDSAIKKATQ